MLEFKRPGPAAPEELPNRWQIGIDRRRVAAYVGAALVGGFLLGFLIARNFARPEAKLQPIEDPQAAIQPATPQSPLVNPASSSEYHKVTRIIRGDTIEVEGVGEVRLIGVETPDGKQPAESYAIHGQNALAFVQKTLLGQDVRLAFDPLYAARGNKNEQNQTMAYVYTRDGSFINSELVRLGLAFVKGMEQFTASDEFRMQEREAVQNSRGVWGPASGAQDGSKSALASGLTPDKPRKVEPLAPSAFGANIPALTGPSATSPIEASVFVSNADHMYHKSGCELLDRKKRAIPLSLAKSEGYTACGRCFASTVLKAP
jgi:micrococcal nuclease